MLEEGVIVEEGKPEELIRNINGRFFRMYTDQKLDALSSVPPVKNSANSLLKTKFSINIADMVIIFLFYIKLIY